MKNLQITAYTQHFIRQQVMPGDICIDATMGNGNDTALLSQLAGKRGRVLAFDIQKQALEHTEERLKRDNCPENYQLLLESHENMDVYAEAETVSCITFNLGYLPGGDHSVATRADSSKRAVESGLKLLKKGGLMTLCIYSYCLHNFTSSPTVLGTPHQSAPAVSPVHQLQIWLFGFCGEKISCQGSPRRCHR